MIPSDDRHKLIHDVKDFYIFLRLRKKALKGELSYVEHKIKELERSHKIKGDK